MAASKGKGNLKLLEETLGSGNGSDTSTSSKVTTRSSNNNNNLDEEDEEADDNVNEPVCSSIFVPNYQLQKCMYTIDDIDLFWHHYNDVHQKTIYVCRVTPCLKWFQSSQGLRGHVKNLHKKELTCEHCGLVNLTPVQLNIHYDSHVNTNFTCNGCQKNFTCKDDSNHHWKSSCLQNPDKVTRCKHCIHMNVDPEVAGVKTGLLNHLQLVHEQKGVFLCTFCHNLFRSNNEITAHSQKCTKTHPMIP